MRINSFKDFEIWKLSIDLAVEVYHITNNSKFLKDFSLRDQIRRAAVSISSNIVEGFEKNGNKEFIHYLTIAKGSLGEVRNQLEIARRIQYIDDIEFNKFDEKCICLSNKLGGFIRYLKLNTKKK